MASGTIPAIPNGILTGSVTAASGYTMNLTNYVQKFGSVVKVYVAVTKASGQFPIDRTVVGNIPAGFRPPDLVESEALICSTSGSGTFSKARISADGTLDITQYGSSKPTWVNVTMVYMTA